jgi:putative ABC transport system ATP-binding protein
MIELRNVEKTVKSPAGMVWLLRRINVKVNEGEFVTVMGPSGAGKTTLLSIIGMLDDGWAGDYVFADQLVHKLDRKKRAELNRRYIGFVFQSYHLLDNLTVQENIDVPLSYRDIPRAQRAAMVADILDRFQIVGKKDLYPNQLSGGQQQLVGVARAVAGNPKLILADEPTGNLHSGQAKEIMELFRRLNQQGTTIIQVTHSEANAAYSHRVIQLKDGWVVDDVVTATSDVITRRAVVPREV